jgi:hypothetical protein
MRISLTLATAQSHRPVHGADAIFVAAEPVVIGSIVRGADEQSSVVVITVALRVPRNAFAGHPRTELLPAASADECTAGRVLTISFSGVPHATPEFGDESARVARVAAALVGRD